MARVVQVHYNNNTDRRLVHRVEGSVCPARLDYLKKKKKGVVAIQQQQQRQCCALGCCCCSTTTSIITRRRRGRGFDMNGAHVWRHHARNRSRTDDAAAADGGNSNTQRDQWNAWTKKTVEDCEAGNPNIELCDVSMDEKMEVRSASLSKPRTAIEEAYDRGKWLVGLLVLQSSSSFVLDSYQELIKEHLVVTLFLTMLVGAGGNAGNQSAIKVIRGMATGSIKTSWSSLKTVLKQQVAVALILGTSLSAAGWIRVYITNGDARNSCAIALSLFLIVGTSVMVGTLLPFGLSKAGLDPANAGTSVQVVMDCLGVLITCVCCHYVLDVLASGALPTAAAG